MAMYMLGLVVAPAVGPVIGGWLTDNYSWRWIFYINIPVCLLAALMMFRFVEDPPYIRDAKPGRIDTGGFILLGIWLAAFQFTLDDGQKKDWFGSAYLLVSSVSRRLHLFSCSSGSFESRTRLSISGIS